MNAQNTSRYTHWLNRGRRDGHRMEPALQFDDAPSAWTEAEVAEAKHGYDAGYTLGMTDRAWGLSPEEAGQ